MTPYLKILMVSLCVPLLCSFYPPLRFWRNFKALAASIGVVVFVFGVWDIFAVVREHWYFTAHGAGPVKLFNLPLEEVLFFVVIPFCCIFTWEVLKFLDDNFKL